MRRSLTTILALTIFLASGFGATVKGNYLAVDDTFNKPNWHTDYSTAYEVAKEQKKMLFIFFTEAEQIKARKEYESRVLANPKVAAKLRDLVLVRVPLTATAKMNGQEVKLLDHPSFAEMHHRQGIAVVDLTSDDQELHGQVVSAFPFPDRRYYSLNRTLTILGLPTGTLTQRTMIFAVRVHPEHPRSTRGLVSRVLMRAARDHSGHQARIATRDITTGRAASIASILRCQVVC